jgi:hypothetical protein
MGRRLIASALAVLSSSVASLASSSSARGSAPFASSASPTRAVGEAEATDAKKKPTRAVGSAEATELLRQSMIDERRAQALLLRCLRQS